MTSSNGNIFRATGHLYGEFTGPGEFTTQRPVMRSFDVYFDLSPNKRLSKQSWVWWFETPSCSLWRHRNVKSKWALWRCLVTIYSAVKQRYGTLLSNTDARVITVTDCGPVTPCVNINVDQHWLQIKEVLYYCCQSNLLETAHYLNSNLSVKMIFSYYIQTSQGPTS